MRNKTAIHKVHILESVKKDIKVCVELLKKLGLEKDDIKKKIERMVETFLNESNSS